jgi:DnaD/phage-associated family protein
LDEEQAALALCRTAEQIRAAAEKLRRLQITGPVPLPQPSLVPAPLPEPGEDEIPQYTSADISRLSQDNDELKAVYAEATQLLGHTLTTVELRVLFGMYHHLGLPADVIFELLHYCAELNRWLNGPERRLTSRFLEKEAYAWANREILTLDQAEEYIRAQRLRHDAIGQVQAALGLPVLSGTQRKDLAEWLEQGFGEEAIAIAADRTVTNTGALKWSYLRKILQNWHDKGLHSPAEIQEKDPSRASRPVAAAQAESRSQKPLDRDAWKKLIGKI